MKRLFIGAFLSVAHFSLLHAMPSSAPHSPIHAISMTFDEEDLAAGVRLLGEKKGPALHEQTPFISAVRRLNFNLPPEERSAGKKEHQAVRIDEKEEAEKAPEEPEKKVSLKEELQEEIQEALHDPGHRQKLEKRLLSEMDATLKQMHAKLEETGKDAEEEKRRFIQSALDTETMTDLLKLIQAAKKRRDEAELNAFISFALTQPELFAEKPGGTFELKVEKAVSGLYSLVKFIFRIEEVRESEIYLVNQKPLELYAGKTLDSVQALWDFFSERHLQKSLSPLLGYLADFFPTRPRLIQFEDGYFSLYGEEFGEVTADIILRFTFTKTGEVEELHHGALKKTKTMTLSF